jgi:AbrB family looped-hinge helix DNA binding protein
VLHHLTVIGEAIITCSRGDFNGTLASALNKNPPYGVLTRHQVRRYLTYMKTTVSSKGQIVLPAEFRQMDGVKPGQEFDVERLDRGDYRLVRRATRPNEGAIDWLLACPQKGFFVAIDSESTDTL